MTSVSVNYSFNYEPAPLNSSARLPTRLMYNEGRSLAQVESDEVASLERKRGKTASKEVQLAVSLQTLPRPNYQVDIKLSDTVSKFFNGKKDFTTKDVFVHNSPMNGQTYEKDGQIVRIQRGATSSLNRFADTVTLLRKIEGANGESYCYAGRVDQKGPTPTAKAKEVAEMVFVSEFDGNGGRGITHVKDDLYTLKFAVQSTLCSSPIPVLKSELALLQDEIKAYKLLAEETSKTPLQITHPVTGQTVRVIVQEPAISQTQLNWIHQLSLINDAELMGEGITNSISKEGIAVSNDQKPWEQILSRAYLCHLMKMPQVIHCKSSVDRTGIAVALVSAMKQYLESGRKVPKNIVEIVNERTIDKEGKIIYPFKELFAAHLRKGLVETEMSRGVIGYKFNKGWSQTSALADLLPERYLTKAPKEFMMKTALRVTSLIASLLLIVFTLGGILKAIHMRSLKGFNVWLNPLKAFRKEVFPKYVIDETTEFGKDLLYKSSLFKQQKSKDK